MAKKENIRNIDQLALLLDLPEWDDIFEMNLEYIADRGQYAFDEALDDSDAEDNETLEAEAEVAREDAEGLAQDEVYGQWYAGVFDAAERLLEEHELDLVSIGDDTFPYEFEVRPKESGQKGWRKAAEALLETINGVGDFYFSSVEDFMDSGPYTAREAVLSHLGYISYYPEIYGSHSARAIYEWSWR
jgi:hypothetical protein